MTRPSTCFLALEPEDAFARQVQVFKDCVRSTVGGQLYLDDPPHVTLYLAVFPTGIDLAGCLEDACRRLAAPTARIDGWHVFEADPLTGNHTLVCDIAPECRPALGTIQQATAAVAAPLRDRSATRARYDGSWQRLSAEERRNIEAVGFPFVGPVWHPHVTVASIRPEAWEAVWPKLAGAPPDAVARFPTCRSSAWRAKRPV